jgi:hypothetical protein
LHSSPDAKPYLSSCQPKTGAPRQPHLGQLGNFRGSFALPFRPKKRILQLCQISSVGGPTCTAGAPADRRETHSRIICGAFHAPDAQFTMARPHIIRAGMCCPPLHLPWPPGDARAMARFLVAGWPTPRPSSRRFCLTLCAPVRAAPDRPCRCVPLTLLFCPRHHRPPSPRGPVRPTTPPADP